MPAQITILLALQAGLFDSIPIEHMNEAQLALQHAAVSLPETLAARLATEQKFSPTDRVAIIEIARESLARFAPESAGAGEAGQ